MQDLPNDQAIVDPQISGPQLIQCYHTLAKVKEAARLREVLGLLDVAEDLGAEIGRCLRTM